MAKKYVPSGYQIININASDKTSGTPFDVETDDEKVLFDLLSKEITKPILLYCVDTEEQEWIGIPVIFSGALCLSHGITGSTRQLVIEKYGQQLVVYYNED